MESIRSKARQATPQLPEPRAQRAMETTASRGLEKLRVPEAKRLGETRERRGRKLAETPLLTLLLAQAVGLELGHQTHPLRAAHLLIVRGKDLINDVLTYQGCASCYLTGQVVILLSSEATPLETSPCPAQMTDSCLLLTHMPIAQRQERCPLHKASSWVKRHSAMQVWREVAQKCYYLEKKKRLNQS